MKRNICILFCIVVFLPVVVAQDFKVNTYHVKKDTFLKSVCKIDNKFYCLNGNVVYVLDDFSKTISDSIPLNVELASISNIDNNLVGITENDIYYNLRTGEVKKIKPNIPILYEDSDFIVTDKCHGEWGGYVFFTDKQTKIEYGCAATCPTGVYKLDDSYYVIATLAHLLGFSTVLKIDDPRKLTVINETERKKINTTIGSSIISTNGTEILLDTTGVIIESYFIYNKELYLVTAEDDFKSGKFGTNLCRIVNKKLEVLTEISDSELWAYNIKNINSHDGIINLFDNTEDSGFLFIHENVIDVYYFKKKSYFD